MPGPILLPSSGAPCEFPCRPPGFDPTHPMAQGMVPGHGFSGVATPATNVVGGFINLLTAQPGVRAGTLAAKTDAYIGPTFAVASNTNHFDFAGQLGEAEKLGTFGSIVINTGAGAFFFNTSSTNAGIAQGFTTAGNAFNFNFNGVTTISSVTTTWATGVPYFFACSSKTNGTGVNSLAHFVVRNLKTGVIQAETVSYTGITGANIGNGSYRIGDRAGALGLTGNVAAMMYAPFLATKMQLYQWALDPWAFWYPYTVLDTLQASIKGPRVQDTAVTGYDSPIYRPQWDQTTWGWNP